MTLTIHLKAITELLLIIAGCSGVLGVLGTVIMSWRGAEIDALIPVIVGSIIAVIVLVLAVGSAL